MTNFDYISEQIKAGKMNAEQMEEFIYNGTFEEFDCDCPDCRKKFLELRHTPYIRPCPFCGGDPEILTFDDDYFIRCKRCRTTTSAFLEEADAIELWNRREDDE